jgi:RNA polymerase sigma-70 factor (ECF subfamily)
VAEPPDEDLIAAARQGDRAAIDALVLRFQPVVYRFGLRMCGDADSAADVLQDTFLSLARSLPAFRGDSSLSTWLYTVARRACLRKRRRRKLEPRHYESLDTVPAENLEERAPDRNPERRLARRQTQAALAAAIASLKPAEREVLLLRDVEGLTAPEVARVLGLGVAAVKSRLHRARVAVRARLEPALAPAPPAAPGDTCPDVLTLFSRNLEGDLAASTCAAMMAHVERCARCRDACESLKRVLALCRDSPAPALPAKVGTAVRDAIRVFLESGPRATVRR